MASFQAQSPRICHAFHEESKELKSLKSVAAVIVIFLSNHPRTYPPSRLVISGIPVVAVTAA